MKNFILNTILVNLLLWLSVSANAQDPNFHIYLCFGQSNMAGAGDIEAQDKTVDSRFQFMKPQNCPSTNQYAGNWYPAIPPLWGCTGGIGPSDYFGRTMVANLPSNVKVGVVVVGVPGCKIELFGKTGYEGQDTYNYVPAQYNGSAYAWLLDLARKAQKSGVIKGFLLHQGESNNGDQAWPGKVKGVYDNLITDLGLNPSQTPLLAGELLYQDQGGICWGHNSIIAKLPSVLPNSYVISASGLPGKDQFHFNSAGNRAFGVRYAQKMISLEQKVPQGPYNGVAQLIPGTIQAEAYDVGGNGSAYYDASAGNTGGAAFRTDEDVDLENCSDTGGGYDVGWATAGEWLEYTVNVQTTGTYNLDLRVACQGDGRTLSLSVDGTNIASNVAIPNTGGWQTWQTVRVSNISLTAGQKILRITIGASDYVNLNYVSFAINNVAPAVSVTAPVNNASFTAPASITINAAASDANGTVSNVQFYNGTTLLGSDATSPYSFTWSSVAAGTYSIIAKATDNAGAVTTSTAVIVTVTNPVTQTPYNGTPLPIPGKIEAEQYDLGGQGVAYNENSSGNAGNAFRTDNVDIETTSDTGGGYDVGWIENGEWLEYTVNVSAAGAYNLAVRVASQYTGGALHIEMDGVNVSGMILVPNTGAWQTFQSVMIPNISLTAGQKVMRIAMDGSWFNINYVSFTLVNTPPSVSITSPTNNATFISPASITINAMASDANGTVSNVQFYNGTNLLGIDATSPYSFTWSNVAAGTYTLTAKATDDAGAVSTSPAVTVTVNSCTPTTITPYVQINGGAWAQTTTASLTADGSLKFGPQPIYGGSWQWTGPNGFTATSREVLLTNLQSGQAGDYTATYTNAGGCRSKSTFVLILTMPVTSTAISEVQALAFPNPSTGAFTLAASEDVTSIKVVDMNGITVYTHGSMKAGESVQFGDNLSSGIYNMTIVYASGRTEAKRIQKSQ